MATIKDSTEDVSKESLHEDKRILALVRFLARRAAEKDYKELLEVLKSKPEYGIVSEQETES